MFPIFENGKCSSLCKWKDKDNGREEFPRPGTQSCAQMAKCSNEQAHGNADDFMIVVVVLTIFPISIKKGNIRQRNLKMSVTTLSPVWKCMDELRLGKKDVRTQDGQPVEDMLVQNCLTYAFKFLITLDLQRVINRR